MSVVEGSSPIWVIRAGRAGVYAEDFLSEGWVGIGWDEVGELDELASDDEIERAVRRAHPGARDGTVRSWVGQIKRFFRDVKPGDSISVYDPSQRIYFLGKVTSKIEARDGHDLCRARRVDWSHRVSRDQLSVSARNSLGAILTLFRLNDEVSGELRQKALAFDAPVPDAIVDRADGTTPTGNSEDEETLRRKEVAEQADRFVEDRIARLPWDDMQELVAGILRAMGYRTRVSDPGPDRGFDVFASPDGLGLEEPRIFAEVKHRPNSAMGAPEIRSFLGGRQTGDRCLYVSTGGFTREARYEAERSPVPLRLLTLPELREIVVEQYESLDPEVRALVPLQRIYWPLE